MPDEERGKIHIRPKGKIMPKHGGFGRKDTEEMKQEIKRLKKNIGRLVNIAEHEESIVEKYKTKDIYLTLIGGSQEEGKLVEITKFQIIVEKDGSEHHYYKSAVIKYHF